VLDLGVAPALECDLITVLAEADRIPKANRRLHAELALEGTQRRVSVEIPVTPGRSSEAILVEHTNDGHHGQAAVGDLSVQLGFLGLALWQGAAVWHA